MKRASQLGELAKATDQMTKVNSEQIVKAGLQVHIDRLGKGKYIYTK